MDWTNEEIVASYKQAKNKIEQIKILSELTCSDIDTILTILEDAGVFEPLYIPCKICYKTFKTTNKKQKICPECKRNSEEVALLKKKLKYNAVKMNSLKRESEQIRQKIKLMEDMKHGKNKG